MTKRNDDTTIEAAPAAKEVKIPAVLEAHIDRQLERIRQVRSIVLATAKALDAQEQATGDTAFAPGL